MNNYCDGNRLPTLADLRRTQHRIDDWLPNPREGDIIFNYNKDVILVPVSVTLRCTPNQDLDSFSLKQKKRYLDGIKEKICQYANYFEKYYDADRELVYVYSQMKSNMDLIMRDQYTPDMFRADIKRYFLTAVPNRDTILSKVRRLTNDQFVCQLNKYVSTNDALCYNPEHVSIMMEMSFLMDIIIPLVAHYTYVMKIMDYSDFFATIIQMILDTHPEVDIHAKVQETVMTLVASLSKNDKKLWDTCQIRGIDVITNTCSTVNTILQSSFPKYTFNENPLNYNIAVIKNSIGHNITEISYEYDFIVHDSSRRDGEDMSSPMDRFEMQREKSDMALKIQNAVNCQYTMESIYRKYRRPTVDEVNFWLKELTIGGQQLQGKDGFQRRLILNLWNDEFGDTASIREIEARDYVSLMILAKERLLASNLKIFPYIISGRVNKLAAKSFICKKESASIEQMEEYKAVQRKYMSPKVMGNVIENIATLLSSEFIIIEPSGRNGWKVPNEPATLIAKEYLQYVLMC